MKSGEKPEKKKERMLTFVPKFSEGKVNSIRTLILFLSLFFVYLFVCLFVLLVVATIEIRDTVAVSAFGMPLPVVKPK